MTKEQARRYRCMVCSHVYDPRDGDPEAGIAPGTPFEAILDTWVCPECGAMKADFEPMDD
jgi:rubredoxin